MRALLFLCLLACASGATTKRIGTGTRTGSSTTLTRTRTLSFPSSPGGSPRGTDYRVKSVWTGPRGGGNALIVDLSTTIVPRFVLRFFNTAAGTVQAYAVRWSLWKLVEYTDVDATPGFQADTDNITRAISLVDPLDVASRKWSGWSRTSGANGVYKICSSISPNGGNFSVELCGFFCGSTTAQNRTGPGAGCPDRFGRSCKPGGTKWSLKIANYPWTPGSSGLALKVAFDSRSAIGELRRNGTKLAEGAPDPQEPRIVAPDSEDDNDAVTDMGDDNRVAWERTVDAGGGTCGNCSTATVIREVYRSGEWNRDLDNVTVAFGNLGSAENVDVNRQVRVSYISFVTNCQPSILYWDPEIINLDANAASGLVPTLGVFFALVGLLFQ